MSKAWIIVLIAFLACLIHETSATCDPIQLSFDLCRSDDACRCAFYIDENGDDFDMFTFLYLRFASPVLVFDNLNALLCNHSNVSLVYNSTGYIELSGVDDFYLLWVEFMANHRFCEINAYMDSVLKKCTCKQDKVCEFISPRDMEFHSSNYRILLWAHPVFVIVAYAAMTRNLKVVYSIFRTISNTHA